MTDASDRAREVLKQFGLEAPPSGGFIHRANVAIGPAVIRAMLAYADERAATAHAAGRAEGMEEAARWHDECAATEDDWSQKYQSAGKNEARKAADASGYAHRRHAAAIRARITTPAGGESHG